MKTHSAVDNVCVFGDSYRTFTVALIVASKTYLDKVAKTLGVTMDHEQLINDINVKLHTMKELISHGIQSGLEKFEIPKDIAKLYSFGGRVPFYTRYYERDMSLIKKPTNPHWNMKDIGEMMDDIRYEQ